MKNDINLKITTLLAIENAKESLCFSCEKFGFPEGKYFLFTSKIDFNKPLKAKINYPCDEICFEIEPYDYEMGGEKSPLYPVGYIAWKIAKKYEEIYKTPEKHNVGEHDIEDLFLEGFILKENNIIEVKITTNFFNFDNVFSDPFASPVNPPFDDLIETTRSNTIANILGLQDVKEKIRNFVKKEKNQKK